MRQARPGDWRKAVGEFETFVFRALDDRYGTALDLLARKVDSDLLDCDAGIWVPRGGDCARHRLSLAWLGNQIVTECERARQAPGASGTLAKSRPSTAARSRQKLVRDLRSVASALKTGPDISLNAIRSAAKHVVSSPGSGVAGYASLPAEMQALLRRSAPLSRSNLADALRAIADDLESQDRRSTPRRRELTETTLARDIVTQLRVATGAPWSYQEGAPIPRGGKPLYGVAAEFIKAAGWRMDSTAVKSRIEARWRA